MNEFLEAADGYVPLLSTLVWVGLLAGLAYFFQAPLREVLDELRERIVRGAPVKVAGVEIGTLVRETSDIHEEVKVHGNPDQLKLMFKAQGKGWKKSTKALELPNGCIVQVTTERQDNAGNWTSAEAVVFVPNVRIEETADREYKLVER